MSDPDRMPPLPRERMTEAQRAAADELIAGPRKGVKGPFIPLLRSPELMARLQKVGEYLRFDSALPPRVSRSSPRWWCRGMDPAVRVGRARAAGDRAAGTGRRRSMPCAKDRRPATMSDDEAWSTISSRARHRSRRLSMRPTPRPSSASASTACSTSSAWSATSTMISMVLNVAHTPADVVAGVAPLPTLPR